MAISHAAELVARRWRVDVSGLQSDAEVIEKVTEAIANAKGAVSEDAKARALEAQIIATVGGGVPSRFT